jgi:diguanylate cyclase (GGDEF)-like protein
VAAALFIDLDNFKDINDTLGHSGGDQLLVEIASRLQGAIRQQDTVGRLGGDEFVVLTEGSEPGGALRLAERILAVLSVPVTIQGGDVPFTVTASIGVAEGNRQTPEELLRDADIALYRAKAAGKERAISFVPAMLDAVHDHRNLEVDLQTALAERQYLLEYQLTIDLSTGEFAGVEALLRWNHPDRGMVQPAAFVPTLETTGMITSVGSWVLHEACRQGARWQGRGFRMSMSVNVSARQLERDRIVRDVQGALSATGFDPGLLILELTETTLMRDVQATVTLLNSLKALGVRIAIDDFGTGYSSLAYLRQLPIDVLKIDRSFVAGLEESGESAAVIHTLVQLGKVLELETVAEGVETVEQHEWIRSEGVDVAQGFLFARPTDAETVELRLEMSRRSPLHGTAIGH